MTVQQHIDAAVADGFEIVQEGRVLIPYEEKYPKPSFADRCEGFRIGMLGYSGQHSTFDNKLFDDDECWVHLRRSKVA